MPPKLKLETGNFFTTQTSTSPTGRAPNVFDYFLEELPKQATQFAVGFPARALISTGLEISRLAEKAGVKGFRKDVEGAKPEEILEIDYENSEKHGG